MKMRDQLYRMLWVLSLPIAFGQTEVDLRTQSKNVDFSAAPSTKPIQTGTTIPGTCAVGQMFFLTTAPAGSNVYGCQATNVWTLEGGGGNGGGATAANQLLDALCARTSGAVVTCSFPIGGTNFGSGSFSTGLTINWTVTISSTSGLTTFYQYWNPTSPGAISIDTSAPSFSGIACNSGCVLGNANASGYPADVKPISRLTAGVTANQWDSFGNCLPSNAQGCIDDRAIFSTSVVMAGAGLASTVASHGIKTINLDPTTALAWTGPATFATLGTAGNCASSGSPAVCGSAVAGSVAIPVGSSVSLVVDTTAVTAASQILLIPDDTLGSRLGITCNSTLATLAGGLAITGRTAGTSFTITYNGTIAASPLCASFVVIN
jgi:hypothetical protein